MHYLNIVSDWFQMPYMILEVLYAVMTLIVSLYAMHIYFISGQKQLKLFGLSFLYISLSYIVESLVNFNIIEKLNTTLENALNLGDAVPMDVVWIVVTRLLFMLGIITLTYITLQINSHKTFFLLLILSVFSLAFSAEKEFMYYLIISVMLIYIVVHYVENTLKYKELKTLLVLIAFIFLLFANIHPLLSVQQSLYSQIGLALEFIAYALILLNLILVVKNE